MWRESRSMCWYLKQCMIIAYIKEDKTVGPFRYLECRVFRMRPSNWWRASNINRHFSEVGCMEWSIYVWPYWCFAQDGTHRIYVSWLLYHHSSVSLTLSHILLLCWCHHLWLGDRWPSTITTGICTVLETVVAMPMSYDVSLQIPSTLVTASSS